MSKLLEYDKKNNFKNSNLDKKYQTSDVSIDMKVQHVCNESCAFIISFTGEKIVNKSYINGKCQKYCTQHIFPKQIIDCSTESWKITDKKSYHINYDLEITTEKTIKVIYDYPLTKSIDAEMTFNCTYTLGLLLETISSFYKYLYEEEYTTARVSKLFAVEVCEKDSSHNKGNIINLAAENSAANKKEFILNCGHSLDKKVFESVAGKNNDKGIICKCSSTCKKCSSPTKTYYYGKVIPKKYRLLFQKNMLRNKTDGILGIYDYDLEDLFIETIYYDTQTKTVRILIKPSH